MPEVFFVGMFKDCYRFVGGFFTDSMQSERTIQVSGTIIMHDYHARYNALSNFTAQPPVPE
jgi:hypothetical protein